MNWFDLQPISKVAPRLFVSGQFYANLLPDHNPDGITAVLNVHQQPDLQRNPSNIVYKHVPFNDGSDIPPKVFVECMQWLKATYDGGHTILVHCAAGISRSVVIASAFMHYAGIMPFNVALSAVKTARSIANPAPDVVKSAKRLLGVFPYDGSFSDTASYEKLAAESFQWMDSAEAAQMHPNSDCPMRAFLLSDSDPNRPRHEIPCTCGILGFVSTDPL